MQKIRRIEQYLKDYGSITSLQIMQLVYSMCPHTIIRDLRKKYGVNSITDVWQEKTNFSFDEQGKIKKQTVRYKKYLWRGAV